MMEEAPTPDTSLVHNLRDNGLYLNNNINYDPLLSQIHSDSFNKVKRNDILT